MFYDGGVTGNSSLDQYTKTGNSSQWNISVSEEGTTVKTNQSADVYLVTPTLLTGDFTAEWTYITGNLYVSDITLLNSNYEQLFTLSINLLDNKIDGNNLGVYKTYVSGSSINISSGTVLKLVREGSTFKYYYDDTLMCTSTITTGDVYFAFKSHSASSRSQTFKNLKIY